MSTSPTSVAGRDDDLARRADDVLGRGCGRTPWSRRRRARRSVAVGVLDRDRHDEAALGAAVLLADDDVLRDVDETTGQVPGVGGTQGGVGQTLAGTVRGDEVLEHRQALAVVRLDRARDDLALRVGHQTTHTGDLAHLHPVTTGTGGRPCGRWCCPSGSSPRIALATSFVAWVQISMSSWRRSSSVMRPRLVLVLDLRGLRLVAVEDLLLVRRGDDVARWTTVTPERVAQWKPASLSASSVAATSTFGYRSARSLTIADSDLLVHVVVDERVVDGQRLVEERAAERRLEGDRVTLHPALRSAATPTAG